VCGIGYMLLLIDFCVVYGICLIFVYLDYMGLELLLVF